MHSVFAVALFICEVAACNAAERSHSISPIRDIDSIIGDAACRSNDDCRTIAVGRKACGGPATYRAWSIRGTDSVALALAADASASAAAAAAAAAAKGRVSDCRFVTDPGAVCVATTAAADTASGPLDGAEGRCALRRGGVGRRAD